jgi:hypothetical protein
MGRYCRTVPTTIPSRRRLYYVLHRALTDFMTQDLYVDLVRLAIAIFSVIVPFGNRWYERRI